MENVSIRKATLQDAAILAKLSADTFYQAFAQQNKPENINFYMDSAFTVNQLAQEIQDPSSIFIIAFLEKKPVGYAKLRKSKIPTELKDANAIEIQRLYVLKALIRQKVGKQLMEQCLAIAEQENYDTVWLGVWEQNPHAIEFYQQWGFEVFDSYIFRLGDEDQRDFLMRKQLFKTRALS